MHEANVRRGRGGRPWRRVKAQVLREAERTNTACWLCGQPIDWALTKLDGRHRWAGNVDHLMPLSRGGEPLDRAGLAVAHNVCNARRGNRVVIAESMAEITSRQW